MWRTGLSCVILLAACGHGFPSDSDLLSSYPAVSIGDSLETLETQVDCPVPAFLFGAGPQLARGVGIPTGVTNPDGGRAVHRWGQWHYFHVDPKKVDQAYPSCTTSLAARGEFRDGDRVGTWEFWFPGGELRARGSFVDGKMDGEWVVWSSPGVRDAEHSGTYSLGVKSE
jgi:hypothetical protein